MTNQVIELWNSQSGSDAQDYSSTATRTWLVYGTDDLDTARADILTEAQADFDGLAFGSLDHEQVGPLCWQFTANYRDPRQADAGDKLATSSYRFSFDTSGGTAKLKISYGTTSYAASGKTAPDFKSAISVDQEGKVDGVDVTIPGLKFSVTYRKAKGDITLAYVKTLAGMTGKTNSDTFYGFAAGELLFLGASGQQATDSDPEVTYNFLASSNATGLTIGGISSIAKGGHQYLWPYYEKVDDTSAKALVPRPHTIFVETVYQSTAFSALGI